jgi:hypothetical protein
MGVASHELRFLESVDNLKPRVKLRFGREPSTTIAREIIACLLQGRLFYEAAEASPLQIRPLQLFYGTIGFAKALIVASRCKSLSTLCRGHGVKDVSLEECRIADLQVEIMTSGTFQEFNNVVADWTRFCYFDESQPCSVRTPAARADKLRGLRLNVRELLSRIPGLDDHFRKTFAETACSAHILIENDITGKCRIRIDDRTKFSNREELKDVIMRWRARFPFLERWRIVETARAWGNSIFYLQNTSSTAVDEFSALALNQFGNDFLASDHTIEPQETFSFIDALPAMGGGYTGGSCFPISPIRGQYLSEFSLYYLVLFLLSSLVRYRPQTWMQAISGTSVANTPADDRALSLIEHFLTASSQVIRQMILTMFNPQEDQYFVLEPEK